MLYRRILSFIHCNINSSRHLTPNSQSVAPPFPSLVKTTSLFFVSQSAVGWFLLFLDFTYKWYRAMLIFVWLETLLSMIICSCICVTANGLQPARLLCPWASPGKNTGVGCHFLLQGIFPTQRWNPCLLLGRQILYHWATGEALNILFYNPTRDSSPYTSTQVALTDCSKEVSQNIQMFLLGGWYM